MERQHRLLRFGLSGEHHTSESVPDPDSRVSGSIIARATTPKSNDATIHAKLNAASGDPALTMRPRVSKCMTCGGNGIVKRAGLLDVLQYLTKPAYITFAAPGKAPPNCRWVCCLCTTRKEVKKGTNDLRGYLIDPKGPHGCCKEDVKVVFNVHNPDQLFQHFGPVNVHQAVANGWLVKPWVDTGPQAPLVNESEGASQYSIELNALRAHNQTLRIENAALKAKLDEQLLPGVDAAPASVDGLSTLGAYGSLLQESNDTLSGPTLHSQSAYPIPSEAAPYDQRDEMSITLGQAGAHLGDPHEGPSTMQMSLDSLSLKGLHDTELGQAPLAEQNVVLSVAGLAADAEPMFPASTEWHHSTPLNSHEKPTSAPYSASVAPDLDFGQWITPPPSARFSCESCGMPYSYSQQNWSEVDNVSMQDIEDDTTFNDLTGYEDV